MRRTPLLCRAAALLLAGIPAALGAKPYPFTGTYWSPGSHQVVLVSPVEGAVPARFELSKPGGGFEALTAAFLGADTSYEYGLSVEHYYTLRGGGGAYRAKLVMDQPYGELKPLYTLILKPSQAGEVRFVEVAEQPDLSFQEAASFRKNLKGTFSDPVNQQLLLVVPQPDGKLQIHYSKGLEPFRPALVHKASADSSYLELQLPGATAVLRVEVVYGLEGIGYLRMVNPSDPNARATAFVEHLPNLSPLASVRELLQVPDPGAEENPNSETPEDEDSEDE